MELLESKYIMGTDIEITLCGEGNLISDLQECFDIFISFEEEFSRFKEDSDLRTLNQKKSLKVSKRFIEVLKSSQRIYSETQGFFNPLVNLSTIGYNKSFEKIKTKLLDTEHLNNVSLDESGVNVHLDSIKISGNNVTLQTNQNLDFGGIVKGYCVDVVSDFLTQKGYKDFIINAGGDIYVSGKEITVAIDSPFEEGNIFALVDIGNKAISTSGTYKRNWKVEQENYHHIMTPGEAQQSNEISSISLISNKCYLADVYATACIAMGLKKSLVFLEEHNIDGIIIGDDNQTYLVGKIENYNLEII